MKSFDPYNFNYKKYVFDTYNLTESPNRIDNMKMRGDDHILNSEDSVWVEKNTTYIGVWNVNNSNLKFRLFYHEEGTIGTYYLLDEDKPFIRAEYSFEQITSPIKGIENKHIWNFKWDKGLIRMFFDGYILDKYPTIISDQSLTDMGYNFWKYLYNEYVKSNNTHKMFILDMISGKTNDIPSEIEMNKYYSHYNSGRLRFVLQEI